MKISAGFGVNASNINSTSGIHSSSLDHANPSTKALVMGGSVTIASIPDHLMVDTLGEFLNGQVGTFCIASQVCKSWNTILEDNLIWKKSLVSRFGSDERLYNYRRRGSQRKSLFTSQRIISKETYASTHLLERRFSSGDFSSRFYDRFDAALTDILISGDKVYIGDNKGRIHVHVPSAVGQPNCDWETPEAVTPAEAFNSPNLTGVSCLTDQGSILLSGHADGAVSVWSAARTDETTRIAAHEDNCRINSIVAPSECFFASSSPVDMSVRITDVESKSESFMRRFAPEAAPNALDVSPFSPSVILVGCRDNSVRLVDVRSRKDSIEISMADWCLCVEWSHTNEFQIRASDKAVALFDLRAPEHPLESRHKSERLVTKFKSDSILRLVSCGLDGEVKLSSLEWLRDPVTIQTRDDYILAVDFDRTSLCFGGINGIFQSFNFYTSS